MLAALSMSAAFFSVKKTIYVLLCVLFVGKENQLLRFLSDQAVAYKTSQILRVSQHWTV